MSFNGNFTGGVEASIPVRLTTTAITDIYTGTDRNTVVAAMTITNETAGAVGVIVTYFDGTTNWNVYRKSVPANDTIQVISMPLRIRVSDKVKVTAATANALTVTLSIARTHTNQDSTSR